MHPTMKRIKVIMERPERYIVRRPKRVMMVFGYVTRIQKHRKLPIKHKLVLVQEEIRQENNQSKCVTCTSIFSSLLLQHSPPRHPPSSNGSPNSQPAHGHASTSTSTPSWPASAAPAQSLAHTPRTWSASARRRIVRCR